MGWKEAEDDDDIDDEDHRDAIISSFPLLSAKEDELEGAVAAAADFSALVEALFVDKAGTLVRAE